MSTWDKVLPMAEFAYNSSVNRSTGVSPFQAYTDYQPRKPINLVPFPTAYRASESVGSGLDLLWHLGLRPNKNKVFS